MNPKTRLKRIKEVLENRDFSLWGANDDVPSVSFYGARGAKLDIIDLKEILRHAESLDISVQDGRLFIWIRLKQVMGGTGRATHKELS